MTTERPPGFDWNNPIPGNPHAIKGEIDRLRDLGERFTEGARVLRATQVDHWDGQTADRFDAFRLAEAKQWETAASAHIRWADALAEYVECLNRVQPRARQAVLDAERTGDWKRASEDIERWRTQLSDVEQSAAKIIEDAGDQLRSLHGSLNNGDTTSTVAPQPTQAPTPEPNGGPRPKPAQASEPPAVRQSPAMLQERTAALCAAILQANFVSAEDL